MSRLLLRAAGEPLTIEGWFRFDTLTNSAVMLYSRAEHLDTPGLGCLFGLTDGGQNLSAYTGAGGTPPSTWREIPLPAAVTTGRWHHLAYVCDGTAFTGYLDGICVGRLPFRWSDRATERVKLGGVGDARDMQGRLAEIRIWNHARTAAQVRAAMHRRLLGTETGLLGYWPMNDGFGRVIRDGTLRNDGILSAGSEWGPAAGLALAPADGEAAPAVPPAVPPDSAANQGRQAAHAAPVAPLAPGGTNVWTGRAGNARWDDDGNWSAGVPAADQCVAIRTGAVIRVTDATAPLRSLELGADQTLAVEGWNSALRAEALRIAGTVTHAANDVASDDWITWEPRHRILIEGSNIVLAATGRLDADGRGYRRGQGPGSPVNLRGGAGHAGTGGNGYGMPGGPAYGDPARPEQPGSGGGRDTGGTAGGGAIRIRASGTLTIDGCIRACGEDAHADFGAGGSGGSVWLSAQVLAGSSNGWICVNGGRGHSRGGGGAGGRIALDYDSARQAALATPHPSFRAEGRPGTQSPYSGGLAPAEMGTLALSDALFFGDACAAGRWQHLQVVLVSQQDWRLAPLVLDGTIVGLEEGVRLQVAGDLVLTNGAELHLFAQPVADPRTQPGGRLTVDGDLRVHPGCRIVPSSHPTNGASVWLAVGRDLHVAATGAIDADQRGYACGFGPGKPAAGSGGAGHGGIGGMAFGGHKGGAVYGHAEQPVEAGSGGGTESASGSGGGVVRLDVGGRAVVEGALSARGGRGGITHHAGGSGGSIWLTCRTLEGEGGLIVADGGLGNYYGGCGGGGRIALHYDPVAQAALPQPVPSLRLSAHAAPATSTGSRFALNAQDGTLWLPDRLWLAGSVLRQRFGGVQLMIPGFNVWEAANLTLDDVDLTLPEGLTLAVAGDLVLTNGARLVVAAAGTHAPGSRYGAAVRVGRDLDIATNSWLVPVAQPTQGAIVGLRVARDARIAAGGGIDASERGYHGSLQERLGPGQGAPGANGGGHGGRGGGGGGGDVYGDARLPLLPGSAAGWNGYGGPQGHTIGGNGGGVIHLLAGGAIRVDGLLAADGGAGAYYNGGGGSGGSLWVAAPRVGGSGRLSARGGSAHRDEGGGGGGRIGVWQGIALADAEARLAQGDAGAMRTGVLPGTLRIDVAPGGDSSGTATAPEAGTCEILEPLP